MKIDTPQIITGTVALVVGAAVMWGISLIGLGQDAVTDLRTRTIVDEILSERLLTDTGTTHGAALATLNLGLNSLTVKMEGIEEDISLMRGALQALAREPEPPGG